MRQHSGELQRSGGAGAATQGPQDAERFAWNGGIHQVARAADVPVVQALLAATSGNQTVLATAFGIGWPDAPHRVLSSALAAAEASDGDVVGQVNNSNGQAPIAKFQLSTPSRNVVGHIEAMALYAGTGVGAVNAVQPAATVVADLVSLLG